MALYAPFGQDFQWQWSNVQNTRPVVTATNYGTAVTVNVNTTTYGAWSQLASSTDVAYDVYGILININNVGASNSIRNALYNIGVDNAGGTAYDIKIPQLIGGSASPYYLGSGGLWYYFPLYIPAGSSIAAQAKGTVAATNTGVAIWLFGLPRRPEAVRAGSWVDAYGIDNTNHRGTTITMGTTADGTLTSLGTITRSGWWQQAAFTQADSSMTASAIHVDIAVGASTARNKILIENQLYVVTAAEQISSNPNFMGSYNNAAAGEILYGRAQSGAASDTLPGIACYMLGG